MKKRYLLFIIIPICLILIGGIAIWAINKPVPNSNQYPDSTWEDSNEELDEDESILEKNKKPQPNEEGGWGPIS